MWVGLVRGYGSLAAGRGPTCSVPTGKNLAPAQTAAGAAVAGLREQPIGASSCGGWKSITQELRAVMSVQQDAVDPDQGGCANMALLALVMLWIGTLLGVSFLATPAKFLAPSLTLPVALDVGRQTFAVFNKIEWVYIVVCALLIAIGPRNRLGSAGLVAVAMLSALQMGWLLPELDVRVGTIIAGGQPPASPLHHLYIVAEVAKLVALGMVAVTAARRLLAGQRLAPAPA